MDLFDRKNHSWFEAEICLAAEEDFPEINRSFSFDWEQERAYEIYKIQSAGEKQILGMMSLINLPEELRIEIHLLELLQENVGKNKRIEHITGCLIAFACKQAFLRGYGGFVSLKPKTKLIQHYQEKYGFRQFGRQLAVHSTTAKALMEKYLEP